MRTKAVPVDKIMSNKAWLIGGAAALAVGGFVIYQNRSAAAEEAAPAYDPWLSSDPVGIAGPYGAAASAAGGSGSFGGGFGGGGAVVSPVSPVPAAPDSGGYAGDYAWQDYGDSGLSPSPSPGQTGPFPNVSGIDPATAELLSQQRLQMEYDFQYQMANMQYNAYVTGVNAWLQYEGLQTLEYTTAANLASSFMFSNNQATFTQVRGSDGEVILDFGGVNMRDSKKDRWNETIVQNLPSIASQFTGAQSNRTAQTWAPPPMPDFSVFGGSGNSGGSNTPTAQIERPTGWSPPVTSPTVQPTQVMAPTATVSQPAYTPTLQPVAPSSYQPEQAPTYSKPGSNAYRTMEA